MCYPIRGGHATRETNWFSETTLFPLLPSTTRRVHYIQYLLYPSSNLSLSEAGGKGEKRRGAGKNTFVHGTGSHGTRLPPRDGGDRSQASRRHSERDGADARGGSVGLAKSRRGSSGGARSSGTAAYFVVAVVVVGSPTGRNLVNTRSPPTSLLNRARTHTSMLASVKRDGPHPMRERLDRACPGVIVIVVPRRTRCPLSLSLSLSSIPTSTPRFSTVSFRLVSFYP